MPRRSARRSPRSIGCASRSSANCIRRSRRRAPNSWRTQLGEAYARRGATLSRLEPSPARAAAESELAPSAAWPRARRLRGAGRARSANEPVRIHRRAEARLRRPKRTSIGRWRTSCCSATAPPGGYRVTSCRLRTALRRPGCVCSPASSRNTDCGAVLAECQLSEKYRFSLLPFVVGYARTPP